MPTSPMINWIARKRGYLLAIPVLFTMFCFWDEFEVEALVWPLGLALVVGGISIRVWAQRYIHWHQSGQSILANSGPYSMVRNPLYIGNLLLLLGATVLSELLWFVPIMALCWYVVYSITVRSEEARCTAKFGEPYLQYKAAVPRWVPRLHRVAGAWNGAGSVLGPLLSESRCLLILVPVVAKEVASIWVEPMMAQT